MGWCFIVAFLVLIGDSTQAPKPLNVEIQATNHLLGKANEEPGPMEDDSASSSVSSSIDQNDLAGGQTESTTDNSIDNDDLNERAIYDDKNVDTVGPFIKKSTVHRSQKAIPIDSYILQEDENGGFTRDAIPMDNDDENVSDTDENSTHKREMKISGQQGDSVSSYIKEEKGYGKDTIVSAKPAEEDSVASYIRMGEESPRYSIPESVILNAKEGLDNDSVASYIESDEGSPRSTVPKSREHNEPIWPKAFKTLDLERDSVGSYIGLVDENKRETDTESSTSNVGSGEAVLHSGDIDSEDHKSLKTQEILQGLEHLTADKPQMLKHSRMDKLSPDVIKHHQMVSESWLERSAFSTAPQMNNSYEDEPFDDETIVYPYIQPQYTYVDISQSESKGAVCLDGSNPGFFYRQGLDSGQKKWIIYLQGGAWCHTKKDCYERSNSSLGSSLRFNTLVNVEGLLSRDSKENPNFFNWNVVYVPYCDGASYTGNRTKPIKVKDRMIYFRGKRILSALLDDLLGYGMNLAEKVVFSGTSAGGLAVLLHADYVRSRIPSTVQVYSLADAGIFLNVANLKKKNAFGDMMSKVYKLHGSYKSIKHKCKVHQNKRNGWKCLFPYYFGKYITSPIFIVNPLYDSWQLGNVIGIHCTTNLKKCSKKEMRAIIDFRERTLKGLKPLLDNPKITLFADSCFDHGQITFGPKWNAIRVKNRSMSGSFARWMMKEENSRVIVDPELEDELFNPTCVTHQIKISKKSFTHSR